MTSTSSNTNATTTAFTVGEKVWVKSSVFGTEATISHATVIRTTKCFVYVLNKYGNKVKYHADGRGIGDNGPIKYFLARV